MMFAQLINLMTFEISWYIYLFNILNIVLLIDWDVFSYINSHEITMFISNRFILIVHK